MNMLCHIQLTLFLFFTLLYQSYSLPNSCNEKCGNLHIPYPFYMNTSCTSAPSAFHLSCVNSTNLFINIDSRSYQVLEFYSDGILLDFPGATSICRQYNDLNSFGFKTNNFFGLSGDNVIGLYDCEDSSLCKADCETINLPGCDGNASSGSPSCCYQLSDPTILKFGDGFSGFSKFGCRGFSSWVVSRGSNTGKRGVKLEWAIPSNSSNNICASDAIIENATSVTAGIRCLCNEGFVGDGFANGSGCSKSCIKNGQEAYGSDCCTRRNHETLLIILAGVLGPVFIITSLIALLRMVKRPVKAENNYHDQRSNFNSTISFRKACKVRLFNYQELENAAGGFDNNKKLADGPHGTLYAGVMGDGSHVAIYKLYCEGERDLMQILLRIEFLSLVLHRNMARLIGCCMDSIKTPLVIYEYPANGTLEEHLRSLDWYKRLNIAVDIASLLTFLQYEISVPTFHHDLKTGCIFLDEDFSVKIAGFEILNHESSWISSKTNVYDFGVLLLEIITGSKKIELEKLGNGKLEEIVDPSLYYHEQPPFQREQIEIVADLAMRCLLFGNDGKITMIDVARKLLHISKDVVDGESRRRPAIEETFSNSSLLQMISLSPDTKVVA